MTEASLTVDVPGAGEVSARLDGPEDARSGLVLAHGAGAGMDHAFMEELSRRLAERDVAVLRYQFPYMEAGRRRPDRPEVATAAVAAAVERARELLPGATLYAGGKSFGARMTTTAAARGMLSHDRDGGEDASVAGLVLFGFPLHPSGKQGTSRADHLADVPHAQLFLQGTRDRLADLELLRPVLNELGERADLHVVEGADHGFHVLVRSGRTDDEVLDELAGAAADWMDPRASNRSGE